MPRFESGEKGFVIVSATFLLTFTSSWSTIKLSQDTSGPGGGVKFYLGNCQRDGALFIKGLSLSQICHGMKTWKPQLKEEVLKLAKKRATNHWECLSLTHWLTDSLLFSKLDWCNPGVWRYQLKTKLVDIVTVANVDDEDCIGNSLLQIW